MEIKQKYRLVTRSDFDGLVCAALLKELDIIDDIKFVHPKDMQDGKIEITARDITTNLPYVPGAYLAFDHHLSETIRNEKGLANHIIDADAPSAARVVYNYYGGRETFPNIGLDMMDAVDKADSAQFNRIEVLYPSGWELLNFLMDARTGLGRFKTFRISNYSLMMDLIDYCRNHGIDDILSLPDVVERVDMYFDYEERSKNQISECTTIHGNLAVLDLRNEEIIYPANRFVIYAMYPQSNISMHVMWGLNKQNIVFAVGKSILNRTSNTNIGELMLKYGGGGHFNAGTCQVPVDQYETVLNELITQINADG